MVKPASRTKGKIIPLLIILLVHTACWFALKPPRPATDDQCYFQSAQDLLAGNYHLTESPKDHRLGVIVPAAFFIAAFGTGNDIIALWPLLCSLLTLTVLWWFWARRGETSLAGLVPALLAVNSTQVNYATVLFPDIIVSLFALLVALVIFRGREKKGKITSSAFLFSLLFIAGFLCKETMLLVLPFVLVTAIADVRKRSNLPYWAGTGFIFLGAVLIFLSVYYLLTGRFTFIYDAVQQEHNNVFVHPGNGELLKRYTYGPAEWLFGLTAYFPLLLFAIPSLVLFFRGKSGSEEEKYFVLYFLLLLAAFWFATTSFSRLAPVPLFERMWMPLLVPLCLLTGFSIKRIIAGQERSLTLLLIALFFASAVIAFLFVSVNRAIFFLLFAAVLSGVHFLRAKKTLPETVSSALLGAPWFALLVWFIAHNSHYLDP